MAALVDTGSDYDAMDRDLSVVQYEAANPSFRGRTRVVAQSVRGFATHLKHTTDFESEWEISFSGTATIGGAREFRQVLTKLSEFSGVGFQL